MQESPPDRPVRPRIVLVTFGTYGDLHPMLAVALALQHRGWHPVLATSPDYRDKVEAEGIEFHPIRPSQADMQEQLNMSQQALVRAIARRPQFLLEKLVLPSLRNAYDDVMAILPGAAALVCNSIAYAAMLAAEQLGVPRFTVALQPFVLLSAEDPPIMAQMPRLSAWLYRHSRLATRVLLKTGRLVARRWAHPIDAFRAEVGLPPATLHPLFEGAFDGRATLALYSPVFGPPQADHPPGTVLLGFAFYDSGSGGPPVLQPELAGFLDAGAPPLVFTLGTSAVHDAGPFVRESLAAVRALGQRAVLVLDQERAASLAGLGDKHVLVTGYASYSLLFPRASVIVHHGGVGTTAQALRAGRPQLVTPCLVDQPDNAARVERLGAGRQLRPARYRAAAIETMLRSLLADERIRSRAQHLGTLIAGEDGAAAAAACIADSLSAH